MNINDKKSVEENVKDLDDLHMLVNLRSDAYKNGQKLDQIHISTCDGILILDNEGKLLIPQKNAHILEKDVRYLPVSDFPNTMDNCPICNKPFTIASLRENCIPTINQKYTANNFDYNYNWYHKSCYNIHKNKLKWDHFKHVINMFEIISQIEEPVIINKVPQPLELFPDCYHVLIPSIGSFYVTIRKNGILYILIEWDDTYPEFSDTLDNIKTSTYVGTMNRSICVNSYTDMLDVLVRAHKSIIKSSFSVKYKL